MEIQIGSRDRHSVFPISLVQFKLSTTRCAAKWNWFFLLGDCYSVTKSSFSIQSCFYSAKHLSSDTDYNFHIHYFKIHTQINWSIYKFLCSLPTVYFGSYFLSAIMNHKLTYLKHHKRNNKTILFGLVFTGNM